MPSKAEEVLEALREPRLRRVVDVDYDPIARMIILLLECNHAGVMSGDMWYWLKSSRYHSPASKLDWLKSKFVNTNFDCRDCCG